MSIHQGNIAAFITFLFRKRKGTEPPQALLDGWSALSNDEIAHQLSGLFHSWGLTDEDKRMEINTFLKETLFGSRQPEPAYPPKTTVVVSAPPMQDNSSLTPANNRSYRRSGFLRKRWLYAIVVILVMFVGYKYVAYKNIKYLYTITDNVSVRNEDNKIVARMDLFHVPGATPSYQKLKALDNEIYYKKIDNDGQLYPFRKVLLKENGFLGYLFNQHGEIGYVNTNYVVDNQNEFDLYQTAFKEVKNNKAENADLKAVYRKIIIGSMSLDPATGDKYITLHTNSISRSTANATYGILKQNIKTNVKYNIVAGLSDGYYYSFLGDIQANEYQAPKQILLVDEEGNSKPMAGNYRFINADGDIKLYDCSNNSTTYYKAVKNDEGNITAFKYDKPNIIDSILDVLSPEDDSAASDGAGTP